MVRIQIAEMQKIFFINIINEFHSFLFFYMSVLHLAIIGGNINIFNYLLQNGAKLEIKDK